MLGMVSNAFRNNAILTASNNGKNLPYKHLPFVKRDAGAC